MKCKKLVYGGKMPAKYLQILCDLVGKMGKSAETEKNFKVQ